MHECFKNVRIVAHLSTFFLITWKYMQDLQVHQSHNYSECVIICFTRFKCRFKIFGKNFVAIWDSWQGIKISSDSSFYSNLDLPNRWFKLFYFFFNSSSMICLINNYIQFPNSFCVLATVVFSPTYIPRTLVSQTINVGL